MRDSGCPRVDIVTRRAARHQDPGRDHQQGEHGDRLLDGEPDHVNLLSGACHMNKRLTGNAVEMVEEAGKLGDPRVRTQNGSMWIDPTIRMRSVRSCSVVFGPSAASITSRLPSTSTIQSMSV